MSQLYKNPKHNQYYPDNTPRPKEAISFDLRLSQEIHAPEPARFFSQSDENPEFTTSHKDTLEKLEEEMNSCKKIILAMAKVLTKEQIKTVAQELEFEKYIDDGE